MTTDFGELAVRVAALTLSADKQQRRRVDAARAAFERATDREAQERAALAVLAVLPVPRHVLSFVLEGSAAHNAPVIDINEPCRQVRREIDDLLGGAA